MLTQNNYKGLFQPGRHLSIKFKGFSEKTSFFVLMMPSRIGRFTSNVGNIFNGVVYRDDSDTNRMKNKGKMFHFEFNTIIRLSLFKYNVTCILRVTFN